MIVQEQILIGEHKWFNSIGTKVFNHQEDSFFKKAILIYSELKSTL